VLFVSAVYISSIPNNSSTIRPSARYSLFRDRTHLPLLLINFLESSKNRLKDDDDDDNNNNNDVLMFRQSLVGGSSSE
jgi:hypothetical protein